MILSYEDLVGLVDSGVIDPESIEMVSGCSIDITMGDTIMVEEAVDHIIDYAAREPLLMRELVLDPVEGHVMRPGNFILAHSREWLDMPLNTSALLRTKSSMGRIGFEHTDAGWIDAGFYGRLTFEFTSQLQYQSFRIRPGDPVGQLIFFRHNPVPKEFSYAERGRYNGQAGASQTRPPKFNLDGRTTPPPVEREKTGWGERFGIVPPCAAVELLPGGGWEPVAGSR